MFTSALALIAVGCANTQKHVEGVAKGWCQTIRASQVLPVYPLTEDLEVGDVFLVQMPIADEAKRYRQRGYLPLDDHRTRLMYTNFGRMYFNNYYDDAWFGAVPHRVSQILYDKATATNWAAPRVAFPTYSFKAQSGYGLSAAFPIQGIPVALSALGTDQVDGSVSISEARTYGGDVAELYAALTNWVGKTNVNEQLSFAARQASPRPVFLRVVSRVYLTGNMDVSLHRARSFGGTAEAGIPGSLSSLLQSTNNFLTNYTDLVTELNRQSSNQVGGAGGAAKFVSVSTSSIGLRQPFDRMLAVGFQGFDVQLFENGTISKPIATHERLLTGAPAWLPPLLELHDNIDTLNELTKNNRARALAVMKGVATKLNSREFAIIAEKLNNTNALKELPRLRKEYHKAAHKYCSRLYLLSRAPLKIRPQRIIDYNDAFAEALQSNFRSDSKSQQTVAAPTIQPASAHP